MQHHLHGDQRDYHPIIPLQWDLESNPNTNLYLIPQEPMNDYSYNIPKKNFKQEEKLFNHFEQYDGGINQSRNFLTPHYNTTGRNSRQARDSKEDLIYLGNSPTNFEGGRDSRSSSSTFTGYSELEDFYGGYYTPESNSPYGNPNFKTSSSYNEKSHTVLLNKTFPSSFSNDRKIYLNRGSDISSEDRSMDFNYNYPKSPKSPRSPKGRQMDRDHSRDSLSENDMTDDFPTSNFNNVYPNIGVSPNNYAQKRSPNIQTYPMGEYFPKVDLISVHDPSGMQIDSDILHSPSLSPNLSPNHSPNHDIDSVEDDSDLPDNFKLPASKSPIIEALVYCSLRRWGIDVVECSDESTEGPAKVIFKVLDFERYYKYSRKICSKQHPTEDISSREKSLRRWFKSFPKKKIRKECPVFLLEIKPDLSKKVYDIIEKYKCLMKTKRRN